MSCSGCGACNCSDNKKDMFVISAYGGEYDDAWSRTEFVTDDKDRGEAYVEKMNALAEAVRAAYEQIGAWRQHYKKTYPQPDILPYNEIVPPRWWAGNVKITTEMREERARIEDKNNAAREAALKPCNDYNIEFLKCREEYSAATFSQEILDGQEIGFYDTHWSIEPINWLAD